MMAVLVDVESLLSLSHLCPDSFYVLYSFVDSDCV